MEPGKEDVGRSDARCRWKEQGVESEQHSNTNGSEIVNGTRGCSGRDQTGFLWKEL